MEFGLWSVNASDALLIQRALLRNVATVVIHSEADCLLQIQW